MDDELERIWKEAAITDWGVIASFAWRDCGKQRKAAVHVAGRVDIRTRDIQNIKQECWLLHRNICSIISRPCIVCWVYVASNETLEWWRRRRRRRRWWWWWKITGVWCRRKRSWPIWS